MALIQTIDSSELFHLASRMGRADQFGYKGWGMIGEFLEEMSDSTGENIEVDIISICCEYSMKESADGVFYEYDHLHGVDLPEEETWEEMPEDEKLETIQSFLQDQTSIVVCEEDLIIWQSF